LGDCPEGSRPAVCECASTRLSFLTIWPKSLDSTDNEVPANNEVRANRLPAFVLRLTSVVQKSIRAERTFLSYDDLTTAELKERLGRVEESLRRSERLAIAGRYAGAVMHEVNNPLEAINNLVYLTQRESHNAEQVRRNMRDAEAQLERLGEITRKTLSYYREQSEAKDFDLVEIAESALRIHAHRFSANSVVVRRHFPQRVLTRVFAGEILQVFSNLILNALDALPETNAVLWMRVRMLGERGHIIIADNGRGIHPAMHKTLFEPYITTKNLGTGIGLWLSKRIIDKHRGTIRFRSSQVPGRNGTIFRVSLPLRQLQ
jgi:signal transduction histidine kinase